jgi:hypothetical protein
MITAARRHGNARSTLDAVAAGAILRIGAALGITGGLD